MLAAFFPAVEVDLRRLVDEGPMRFVSSARDAPVSAAKVFPVCRKSWTWTSARRPVFASALAQALVQVFEKFLRQS